MSLSTPYLVYILGAYGITLFSLACFLGWAILQWRKSQRTLKRANCRGGKA